MTDCTHNDKRTCFKEKMELIAKIQRLEAAVALLGEIAGMCTYLDLKKVCSYCRCGRKPDESKVVQLGATRAN